jgi:hypothetical protein
MNYMFHFHHCAVGIDKQKIQVLMSHEDASSRIWSCSEGDDTSLLNVREGRYKRP